MISPPSTDRNYRLLRRSQLEPALPSCLPTDPGSQQRSAHGKSALRPTLDGQERPILNLCCSVRRQERRSLRHTAVAHSCGLRESRFTRLLTACRRSSAKVTWPRRRRQLTLLRPKCVNSVPTNTSCSPLSKAQLRDSAMWWLKRRHERRAINWSRYSGIVLEKPRSSSAAGPGRADASRGRDSRLSEGDRAEVRSSRHGYVEYSPFLILARSTRIRNRIVIDAEQDRSVDRESFGLTHRH